MVSAQRFRTLASRMAFDLGGRENLTEAQQQLIRRCAMISAQCELMEAETVQGKPLNAIAYGTLTGHLTRTLNALGLKREPIDVTPVQRLSKSFHFLDQRARGVAPHANYLFKHALVQDAAYKAR